MNDRVVTVDVREDIRTGREPFSKIMGAANSLGGHQFLRLIAPFEPTPLYAMLGKQGFSHKSKALKDGSWEIIFTRAAGAKSSSVPAAPAPRGAQAAPSTEIIEVDARGLEPPQPLVTILEAVEELAEGASIRARTDRRPLHLYPLLEERGFTSSTQESPDGSYVTDIRRH